MQVVSAVETTAMPLYCIYMTDISPIVVLELVYDDNNDAENVLYLLETTLFLKNAEGDESEKTTFHFILYRTVVKWKEMEAQVDDKPKGSTWSPLVLNLNCNVFPII